MEDKTILRRGASNCVWQSCEARGLIVASCTSRVSADTNEQGLVEATGPNEVVLNIKRMSRFGLTARLMMEFVVVARSAMHLRPTNPCCSCCLRSLVLAGHETLEATRSSCSCARDCFRFSTSAATRVRKFSRAFRDSLFAEEPCHDSASSWFARMLVRRCWRRTTSVMSRSISSSVCASLNICF